MMLKKYSLFLLLIVIIFSFNNKLYACSCKSPANLAEAIDGADEIFIGKVTKINIGNIDTLSTNYYHDLGYYSQIEFEVSEQLLGVFRNKKSVKTGTTSGNCGFPFSVGDSYLVYAGFLINTDSLYTNFCGNTSKIIKDTEEINILRSKEYYHNYRFEKNNTSPIFILKERQYYLNDLIPDYVLSNMQEHEVSNEVIRERRFYQLEKMIFEQIKSIFLTENNFNINENEIQNYKESCGQLLNSKINELINIELSPDFLKGIPDAELGKHKQKITLEIKKEMNDKYFSYKVIKDILESHLFKKELYKKYGGKVTWNKLPFEGYSILISELLNNNILVFPDNSLKMTFLNMNRFSDRQSIQTNKIDWEDIECIGLEY